jgi:Ca2+/Na+ antiporter
MAGDIGFFLLGILLLLLGGDSVLRGASGLAQRFGVPQAGAGLLMVLFASSIPELVVNAYAVSAGQPDLALGNAVGSNIVNIGLTLGIAALVAPLFASMRLLAVEVVLVLVATGAVLLAGLDGTIARWEGALLLAGFAAFLLLAFRRLRDETAAVQEELDRACGHQQQPRAEPRAPGARRRRAVFRQPAGRATRAADRARRSAWGRCSPAWWWWRSAPRSRSSSSPASPRRRGRAMSWSAPRSAPAW